MFFQLKLCHFLIRDLLTITVSLLAKIAVEDKTGEVRKAAKKRLDTLRTNKR